jgi:acyl dehydratase
MAFCRAFLATPKGGGTMRHFEDFTPGTTFRTSSVTLTEDEIVAFAREHDPQSFHTDPEAARTSPYGGLIASGFQTMLVAFRLSLAEGGWADASMGSPGMDALRWVKPVRPGDSLHVEAEVASSTPSRSRPDRGFTVIDYAVKDAKGDTVMTYRTTHILRRRPN